MAQNPDEALTIAAFFDLENLAIGVREVKLGRFDVGRVLGRLLEKGNVLVKKAYAEANDILGDIVKVRKKLFFLIKEILVRILRIGNFV